MKIGILRHLLAVGIVVSFFCLPGRLSAGQNPLMKINEEYAIQASALKAQVPQALKDFVVQAMQEGLSIEQIVQQALAQGHTKEEIASACSVIMDQENNESMSLSKKLMLGIVGVVVLGVGVWYLYHWLKPATENDGAGRYDGEAPRVNVRRCNIVPQDGVALPGDGNQRVNELIAQGLAEGRGYDDLVRQARQMFPDVAFQVNVDREIRGERIIADGAVGELYAPWNNDPFRDRNLADLFDAGAGPRVIRQQAVPALPDGRARRVHNPVINRLEMRPRAGQNVGHDELVNAEAAFRRDFAAHGNIENVARMVNRDFPDIDVVFDVIIPNGQNIIGDPILNS